jgi:TonB-linked SusC/RagA family outer membrane protein
MGGFNFNFKDKIFLTGTFRADGSSRFLRSKWGYFPGFSAAWNLHNESIFKNGIFSNLKLRFGWGQTGNNAIANFAALQLFSGGANYEDAPGTGPSNLGNPDLKWETTTQTNIGLDFGFLKDRVTASVDVYVKTTDDLLLNRPIPTISGFTSVLQNVGKVENKGVDLTINSLNINQKNITWSTTFTLGYLKNKVIKLVDGIPFDIGFANIVAEGQPIGSFFGHITDGIFQNQAEIDAHASQPNAEPGDIRFKDIGGGAGPDGILATTDDLPADNIINDDDRTYIGKALPDFTGGIVNDINLFGFEISAFFQFATGFQIMNVNNLFAEGLNSVFSPTQRGWDNAWRAEGDQTEVPRIVLNDPNGNRRNSTRFVEKGDYIRLKTLSIGYRLPKQTLENIKGISDLKIYMTGYNLWTKTDYSWFDPEVNLYDGSNTALGTDFLTFPQPRSIVFGINLGF